MPRFVKQSIRDVLTHVAVGMGAASFWRGAWYVLDDHLFPDNAEQSATASLLLGVMGMTASQGLMHKCEMLAQRKFTSPRALRVARFGALYTVAVSVVLVWRGTWIGWDCLYERLHPHNNYYHHHHHLLLQERQDSDDESQQQQQQPQPIIVVKSTDRGHATHSGLLSHVTALTLLLGTGLFASVLAPPAAVSVLRDWAVRTASPGSKMYQGPAQMLTQHLFGRGGSTASSSGSSAAAAASTTINTSAASGSAAARALSTRIKTIPKSPMSVRRSHHW